MGGWDMFNIMRNRVSHSDTDRVERLSLELKYFAIELPHVAFQLLLRCDDEEELSAASIDFV